MNLKLTLAAAALLASLTATATLASDNRAALSNAGSLTADFAPAPPCKVIYLSDRSTARDYIYLNFSPWTAYSPLPQLPAADDGWGLWATSSLVYAGAAPNKINIHKPCNKLIGFSLTTAGAGPPASIAADPPHNAVYATEFGSATIDWFNAGTDTPGAYDAPRAPGLPFYLAVDKNGNVYTSGWDPTNTFEQIDICGPGMTGCAFCEAIPAPSSPGGLTIDQGQHLIVNNAAGILLSYFPICAGLDSSYFYSTGNSKFTFTDITLSTTEKLIWAANLLPIPQPGCSSAPCMDAQAVMYNSISGVIGPIGTQHTAPIRVGQKPGTGIAVWPPGPV